MHVSSYSALRSRIVRPRKVVPGATDQPWLGWAEGASIPADLEWLGDQIGRGTLPPAIYSWVHEDEAARRAERGVSVIVWMLDETAHTRHRVVLSGRKNPEKLVLTAPFASWVGSLNEPA